MSGVQQVFKISDFVYYEISIGLRVQKSYDDSGYRSNQRMLLDAEKEATTQALQLRNQLLKFQHQGKVLEFLPIENEYVFSRKGTVVFEKYPTLINESETTGAIGRPGYVQLKEDPRIVVRFKSIPKKETLDELRRLIKP